MKPALRPLTTILLTALAAALPLQAQSPPPAHPDTWPPHFVSLTPDLLYEVEPSDYIADPATRDGAQLFYAPVQGDDPVATLQGAAVLLVRPYNIVERQEAPLREWECVWGTLDHLYHNEVPQFWRRPSTAFYSCTYPTRRIKKGDGSFVWQAQIDFVDWTRGMRPWQQVLSRYYAGLSDKPLSALGLFDHPHYNIASILKCLKDKNTLNAVEGSNALLAKIFAVRESYPGRKADFYPLVNALQSNTTILDFRNLTIPGPNGKLELWEQMLNRRVPGGSVRSEWVSGQWLQRANAGGRSPFVHWWMADWREFAAGTKPGDPGAIVWEEEFVKTLNETAGAYDGLLCLKDAERVEKDFIKKAVLPDCVRTYPVDGKYARTPQSGTVPFSQSALYAEVLQNAKVDPDKDPGKPPVIHLVPFAAKVHQKDTPENGNTTALAKAVILSDGLATRQDGDFVILAIACDWKDKSSASDGITVTKTYQSNSTLEQDLQQRVDRAEYSRIARSNYTFRTDPQTQEASYTWQGPSSGVRLEENALQSPAAFRAGASGLKYRLLVAVREDIDGKWTLMAEPEPMTPITSDEGTYYAYTRENLAQTVRQTGCRSLAKSITFASPEKPGRYFLYEVDVLQDYSLTPCIRYGNMKHLWVLRKGAHRKYTDHTDMTEIYTIFGDSTWPKSGVIAEKPSPYNNTVLVWEDALKALTVRFTGDVARERTIDTQYQKGRCYQPTENGKADHSDILALLAYGQQLFTSQNERALGGSFHNAIYMQFVINEEWTELASCDFRLSSLLSDINNAYSADVVCSESSGCLSVLPRLCGYHQIIEMIAAKSLASSSANHGYNVCHSKQYDAYPPNRKEGEPDPPRTRINSLFKKGQLYDFNFTIYEKSLDIKFINLN